MHAAWQRWAALFMFLLHLRSRLAFWCWSLATHVLLSSSWCPGQMLMVPRFKDASALPGFGCLGLLCSIALLQVWVAWFLVFLPLCSTSIQENLCMKKTCCTQVLEYRLWFRAVLWVSLAQPYRRPCRVLPPAFLRYFLLPWPLSVLPQATVVVSSSGSKA